MPSKNKIINGKTYVPQSRVSYYVNKTDAESESRSLNYNLGMKTKVVKLKEGYMVYASLNEAREANKLLTPQSRFSISGKAVQGVQTYPSLLEAVL